MSFCPGGRHTLMNCNGGVTLQGGEPQHEQDRDHAAPRRNGGGRRRSESRRRVGVRPSADALMDERRDRLSFLGRRWSPSFEVRVVTVAAGRKRAYDEAEWRDALVVLERGEIELECLGGSRRRFRCGDVLWLVGSPLTRVGELLQLHRGLAFVVDRVAHPRIAAAASNSRPALDVAGEPTPARPTATTSAQRAWLRRTTPSRSGTWPA